jgi:hypothetical protein
MRANVAFLSKRTTREATAALPSRTAAPVPRPLLGEPGVVASKRVVRDAEDFEARAAVEVDELTEGGRSVAPGVRSVAPEARRCKADR